MPRSPSLTAQQAFDAVARLASIKAAADDLHVTPGAVSRQIKLLEDHFGVALIQRSGRGIILTAPGLYYAEAIRPAFEQLRRASRELDAKSALTVINLRSYTTFATRWLISRLAPFQLAHPDVEVRLTMSSQWTELGELDAAIRLGDGWPDYQSMPLVANTLLPLCSPEVAATCRGDIGAMTRNILFSTPHRPDDWLLWLKAAGVKDVAGLAFVSFESSAVAIQAAIASKGVALVQQVLVENELASGALVCPVDLYLDRGGHTYRLVWKAESAKAGAIQALGDWLIAHGGPGENLFP